MRHSNGLSAAAFLLRSLQLAAWHGSVPQCWRLGLLCRAGASSWAAIRRAGGAEAIAAFMCQAGKVKAAASCWLVGFVNSVEASDTSKLQPRNATALALWMHRVVHVMLAEAAGFELRSHV